MKAKLYLDKWLLLSGSHPEIGRVVTKNNITITVCEWSLKAWRFAAVAGFNELPPPMSLFKYDRQPYTPYEHQITTSNFLVTYQKCACWNEAGTGKTASVIWAIDYLCREDVLKKVLVVCPLSTAQCVWYRELFTMMPWMSCEMLLGTREKRQKNLDKKASVYIINHDGIKVLENELIKWKPDLIVVDECTAFKKVTTARWKTMRNICKASENARVWMLTGTPMAQSPTDLYGQARLFCPDRVGKSFVRFRDLVMTQVSMYEWRPRPNFEQIIKEIVQPVIRFSRDECIDLPDVVNQDFEVEMSMMQQATFNKLRREAVVAVQGGAISAVNEGVMRSKLLQCCAGWVYAVDESGARGIVDLSPKKRLDALLEVISESSRGVLVFMPFTSAINNVSEFLSEHKVSNEIINGAVTVKRRTVIFDRFQKGEIKVLVAHPKTMGHGLTLTAADTIVWYLVMSDNELYEQACSRIQRIGQEHKMRVIHLVSTALEKKVLRRLQQKQAMQGVLLETLEQGE